jgi:hypothetical protein
MTRNIPRIPGFSLDALWSHCVATATAAHRIAIEEGLEKDKVSAVFKNGVLTITVPKSAEAKNVPASRLIAMTDTHPSGCSDLRVPGRQRMHGDAAWSRNEGAKRNCAG